MEDLREKAAQAIYAHRYGVEVGDLYPADELDVREVHSRYGWFETADAAIAAIEPDIRADERRKVFEELIDLAIRQTSHVRFPWLYGVADGEPLDDEGTVADWLLQKQEAD